LSKFEGFTDKGNGIGISAGYVGQADETTDENDITARLVRELLSQLSGSLDGLE
jgi:hypothetical protein